MERKYNVFPERFNGVLDLVEIADAKLAKTFKKLLSALPNQVKEELKEDGETVYQGRDYP